MQQQTEELQSEWYKMAVRNAGDLAQALHITEEWCAEDEARSHRYLYKKNISNTSLQMMMDRQYKCWYVSCKEMELADLGQRLNDAGLNFSVLYYHGIKLLRPFYKTDFDLFNLLLLKGVTLYQPAGKKPPKLAKPATTDLPFYPNLQGRVQRLPGQKEIDNFFVELLGETYYLEIPKGSARPAKKKEEDGINKGSVFFTGQQWFALRMLYAKEFYVEKLFKEWVEECNREENEEWESAERTRIADGSEKALPKPTPMYLETFLPADNIDLSREAEEAIARQYKPGSVAWKKRTLRLIFTGYLFVKINTKLLQRLIDGAQPISGMRLINYMMKQKGIPQAIPTVAMEQFMAAVDEQTLQLGFGDDESLENQIVVFRGTKERMHLKGSYGRILYKKRKMYFTLLPIMGGNARFCKGFEVSKKEVRKATKKELKEKGIGGGN